MKVSKLKTLLYFLGVFSLFATISVDAASISITKTSDTSKENIAKYEVYLDATDGEISGVTITFSSSDEKIKPQIRKADNLDNVTCGTSEYCKLDGTYSSKIKIADITVENTTTTNIENFSITAVASNGLGTVSSDPIILKSEEIETTTTKAKSTNAELSNITFSVTTAQLSPEFNTEQRSYTVTGIKDTVNSITISTSCDNCATTFTCLNNCSISENKNNRIMLEEGSNEIELVTTSEDGSKKETYNFIIYRGEVEEPSAYLKSLEIKDYKLDTKFDILLNDYTATVDLDVEKLDINYETEDPEAKVEIKGADKLVEGENVITITVTSSDEKSKQVYTITVTKEDLCDPETEECNKQEEQKPVIVEKKKNNKIWLIIILIISSLTIIGLSAFFIFRKKKNKNDKNNKSDNNKKIKKVFIEEEPEKETNDLEKVETPKTKTSVDEALDDLMKTKEIELNDI